MGCTLAEGPVQLRGGDLAWVDILAGRVHRWNRRDAPTATALGEPVGAIAETSAGTVLAACKSGLRELPADDRAELLVALPSRAPDLRMNDGKSDPLGRFLGGTMALGAPRPGAGSLWSFDGGEARELVSEVTISNGLAWSATGDTLYYIDTPTHRIDAFDYDLATGDVADRRTHVAIDPELGSPDGMCIDDEGGLWVAMWGGGAVLRFAGSTVDERIDVPTPYVTCPVFAGEALDQLVITTAAEPFGDQAPAGAGDLYIADVGVTGPPADLVDRRRLLGR